MVISTIFADIAASASWSFVQRYWKPLLLGAAGLSTALTIWVLTARLHHAQAERDAANAMNDQLLQINEDNLQKLAEIAAAKEADRKATAAELERHKAREEASAALKKGLRHEPTASNPVDPFFDALGNRLRQQAGD